MGITAFVYSSLWESFAKFAIYPWQEETNLLESLKWHYDQILVFPRYLGKFQSIRNINTYAFDLFSENLRPTSKSLWELEKMTSLSQNYHSGWNYNKN